LWAAAEDVVLDLRAEASGLHAGLHSHLEALGLGLASPEDGVDGFEEGGHAVVALGAGTVELGDVAIGAGDVAVGASGDVDDNFPGSFHGASPDKFWEIERRDMTKNRTTKNGCATRGRLAWPI